MDIERGKSRRSAAWFGNATQEKLRERGELHRQLFTWGAVRADLTSVPQEARQVHNSSFNYDPSSILDREVSFMHGDNRDFTMQFRSVPDRSMLDSKFAMLSPTYLTDPGPVSLPRGWSDRRSNLTVSQHKVPDFFARLANAAEPGLIQPIHSVRIIDEATTRCQIPVEVQLSSDSWYKTLVSISVPSREVRTCYNEVAVSRAVARTALQERTKAHIDGLRRDPLHGAPVRLERGVWTGCHWLLKQLSQCGFCRRSTRRNEELHRILGSMPGLPSCFSFTGRPVRPLSEFWREGGKEIVLNSGGCEVP